jgi:hypothetical protein
LKVLAAVKPGGEAIVMAARMPLQGTAAMENPRVRYGLFDIDRIISPTLVYAVVTGL